VTRALHQWGVVTEVDGRAVVVEGPYRTRALAREMLAEIRAEDEIDGCAHRIVPVYDTLTSSQFEAWMARQRAS